MITVDMTEELKLHQDIWTVNSHRLAFISISAQQESMSAVLRFLCACV